MQMIDDLGTTTTSAEITVNLTIALGSILVTKKEQRLFR